MVVGGITCIKYLIFSFNLLFALFGIAILTVGIIIQGVHTQYSNFLYSNCEIIPLTLIIVGLVIFTIAFFGCCGAVKESYCLILTFSVLLISISILELTAGIIIYTKKYEVEYVLENKLNSTMFSYFTNPNVKNSWDIAQHELKCCGIQAPGDWYQVTKNDTLPHTCCSDTFDDGSCTMKSTNKYNASCLEELKKVFIRYEFIIGGIGVGIIISQIIGTMFACCLAHSIGRMYEIV